MSSTSNCWWLPLSVPLHYRHLITGAPSLLVFWMDLKPSLWTGLCLIYLLPAVLWLLVLLLHTYFSDIILFLLICFYDPNQFIYLFQNCLWNGMKTVADLWFFSVVSAHLNHLFTKWRCFEVKNNWPTEGKAYLFGSLYYTFCRYPLRELLLNLQFNEIPYCALLSKNNSPQNKSNLPSMTISVAGRKSSKKQQQQREVFEWT